MENHVGESVMPKRNPRRLALFPVPLQGHINPMLQLANIFHSKGFHITFIHTTFNAPNKSNYPNFTFRCISEDLGTEVSLAGVDNAKDLLITMNEKCGQSIRNCLADLLSGKEGEPIGCLIPDALWYCTQAIAESLDLPRIVLQTTCLSALHVYTAFPRFGEMGYLSKQDDSILESRVEGLEPLKFKDIPKIITGMHEDVFMLLGNMIKEMKASSGIIWNSIEELEDHLISTTREVFPTTNFLIGPLHNYFPASSSNLLDQDRSCISWLDKQYPKSVIYVSYGSIADMGEAEFLEMATGIANSKQPFLWVVRPGIVSGSDSLEFLPNGFLEGLGGRGYIVKWCPQLEVLAHPAVRGFLTHSGWNSTLEAIFEGVPMICSPSYVDQPLIARYVCDVWKVGVQLEKGLERGEIERAIRRVIEEKEGEEIRERMARLKDKVNNCLKEGGSSYQSLESLINLILSF